jgi:outer membrane lipoprotein-sorting protein
MKRIITVLFLIIFVFATEISFAQQDIDATTFIKKADEKIRGKTNTSQMKMIIVRPSWKRTISMKSWGRGLDYSMTYITAPAKEKGQVFMKRKTEMWNWVPSISRMIKIPSSMMSQGWMGSDYTNDDILKESSIVYDYTHKFVGKEKIQGHDTYKIEMIPKEDAAVIWRKIYKWVTVDGEYIQMKSEYYDEDNELIKSDFSYDLKKMDGRLIPSRIEIIPANEDNKKTVLYIEDIKFDIDLPESFFSQQQMKRVR